MQFASNFTSRTFAANSRLAAKVDDSAYEGFAMPSCHIMALVVLSGA